MWFIAVIWIYVHFIGQACWWFHGMANTTFTWSKHNSWFTVLLSLSYWWDRCSSPAREEIEQSLTPSHTSETAIHLISLWLLKSLGQIKRLQFVPYSPEGQSSSTSWIYIYRGFDMTYVTCTSQNICDENSILNISWIYLRRLLMIVTCRSRWQT